MHSHYARFILLLGPFFGWANAEMLPSIASLEMGEGVHAVQVAQNFFGTPGICEEGPKNQASIFFATHLDPNTLELTCGIFQRDVGACFKRNILVGCDPKTHTATIDLYVRDESFSRSQKTDNPKLGRCKAGFGDSISRAIKVTETFPCTPPEPSTGPGTCSDTHDNCGKGTFCIWAPKRGHFCREYVALGEPCGGEVFPGDEKYCNPRQAYCLHSDCLVPDAPGICTAYGGICATSDECMDDEYCSVNESRCRTKLNAGDCCSQEVPNQCQGGFCSNTDVEGIFTCKSYVPPGSSCGGFRVPGGTDLCDPAIAFCYNPESCAIPDLMGTCIAYLGTCTTDADCGFNEYCEGGFCKPKILQGECCNVQYDLCAAPYSCQFTSALGPRCAL